VSEQDQEKPADPAADLPGANGETASNGVSADGEELEDKRMSLLEHLQELRVRLRNAGIAFLLAMVLSFVFVRKFFEVLVTPTVEGIIAAGQKAKFQATTPTEGFWVMMKLAVVGGLLVAAPLVFWELWKFVAPGLYKKEKRMALGLTLSTAICFTGGAVFGYFVLSKPAAYFLTQMLTDFAPKGALYDVVPEYRIGDVTDFLILTLAGCGAAFELPVVLVTLGAVGIVSSKGLWKFNKYALILSAVAGAVLTPSTDVFTQVLLAGPLYALYNISILLVWLIERGRRKREVALEASYKE
jgi:sec-independent protein translocase protein TatC